MTFKEFPARKGGSFCLHLDHDRSQLITRFGHETLKDRYLMPSETAQDMFGRVAAWFANDGDHAQRLYDYMSRHWFMPSTPILSNGGLDRGNPISCFLNSVGDSLAEIDAAWSENVWLAAKGGGIGTNWSDVRGLDERIGQVGKSSGTIPFIKVMDSLTLGISQGSLRRGSAAVYLDIDHPDIERFIEIRKPTGDPNNRCLNIHHGINLSDAFMEAVRDGKEWDLIGRKDGEVYKTVSARKLWQKLLSTRMETGEPYLLFIDRVNATRPDIQKELGLKVRQSNLCVAPETRILTDRGYVEIASVAGSAVNVWNGEEFSETEVFKTGENQALVTVTMSDGSTLECTPYHKFYVESVRYSGRYEERRAHELKNGDRLIKWSAPVIEGGSDVGFENAYRNGFFSGDGTYGRENPIIYLYGEKRELVGEFVGAHRAPSCASSERTTLYYRPEDMWPKFAVPHGATLETRLDWLAGLADADGYVARNGENQSLQITSTERGFIEEVRLMLQTCGVNAKIALMHPERVASMPDGKGGYADFDCRAVYRLLVNSNDLQLLRQLGFAPRRLEIKPHKPQRSASRFVAVTGVVDEGRVSDTYCFTEPKRHMGVFNGVLTGQCSEITLPTGVDHLGEERTAVCCLSSVNLERFLEWEGEEAFIKDVLLFLDNVLQDFIDRTEGAKGFDRARYAAMRERSVGLGAMGFHSFLQSQGLPFEGVMAKVWNRRMFAHIDACADKANEEAARELGACPDSIDATARNSALTLKRWSNTTSVAPTASISIICGGTSAGIEPINGNIYTHKTLSGSFAVKNRHLEAILRKEAHDRFGKHPHDHLDQEMEDWVADQWSSIVDHEGSVQHLDWLDDDVRAVFRTAFEIDPRWYIEHAADRAPFVEQAVSNNLFLPPKIHVRDLHELHFSAWEKGVKSLYYCRSKSIQRAQKVSNVKVPTRNPNDGDECLACQ